MTRENVEIVIVMKNGHIGTNGDSANETIDQLANGFPFLTTEAIESGCIVVVPRLQRSPVRAADGGYADAVRRAPATIGRAPSDAWRCAPSHLALRPPAATPALGEWIALNERPRLRPARHPHRPSRAVARSPGLSKTSDRWWCPPRTRSEQCLESCNSRALRASGSRRPACGWTLEDRRNWPRVQRNGRWEMLWTLSVHNNSMGSVPIRSPNTILFSGHRCRSTS